MLIARQPEKNLFYTYYLFSQAATHSVTLWVAPTLCVSLAKDRIVSERATLMSLTFKNCKFRGL